MSETETKTIGVKRKDGKFFQVANTIIDDWGPVIGSDGVAIYCLLERKSNSETGTAWMGHDWIAERLCLSTDTVGVVLGDLETLGLVSVERQRDPDTGRIKRSLYTVIEPTPACTVKAEDAPRVKRIEARKAKKAVTQSVQISKVHTVPFSKDNTEQHSKPIPDNSVDPYLTIRQYKDSVLSDKDSTSLDKDQKGEAANAAAQRAPVQPSKPVAFEDIQPAPASARQPTQQQAEVAAWGAVMELDIHIPANAKRVGNMLTGLRKSKDCQPTADIAAWRFGRTPPPDASWNFYSHTWQGQKGQPPTEREINQYWATWLKPALKFVNSGNGHARAAPKSNKTASAVDEFLRDLEQPEQTQVLDAQGRVIYG